MIGMTSQHFIVYVGGNNMDDLIELGEPLLYYSIFSNKPQLWSNMQKEHLVAYKDDPLWPTMLDRDEKPN